MTTRSENEERLGSASKNIEWSDTWADEDAADAQRASWARFEEREPEHVQRCVQAGIIGE